MGLDESRNTRDYLYGRLLAIADNIEAVALRAAKQERDTNAARLMQRFADHPFTTWRTIRLQLNPYMMQLRSSRPGALAIRSALLDEVTGMFKTGEGGVSEFENNARLSGEFLLGFHSQREALKPKQEKTESTETNEGDNE